MVTVSYVNFSTRERTNDEGDTRLMVMIVTLEMERLPSLAKGNELLSAIIMKCSLVKSFFNLRDRTTFCNESLFR